MKWFKKKKQRPHITKKDGFWNVYYQHPYKSKDMVLYMFCRDFKKACHYAKQCWNNKYCS